MSRNWPADQLQPGGFSHVGLIEPDLTYAGALMLALAAPPSSRASELMCARLWTAHTQRIGSAYWQLANGLNASGARMRGHY